jgi:hypothetical protein
MSSRFSYPMVTGQAVPSQAELQFGLALQKREGVSYPSIQEMKIVAGGSDFSLGYRIRDYGNLLLSIINRVEIYGENKSVAEKVNDYLKLPKFFGNTFRSGSKYTNWMIDEECPAVDVIFERIEKGCDRHYLGKTGDYFLKSASSSPNIVKSFEDLVLLRILSKKLQNLSLVLKTCRNRGFIVCRCTKAKGATLHTLKDKYFSIPSNELSSVLGSAFLVHSESPVTSTYALSSSTPIGISGLVYNEIYQFYHRLREEIQTWTNESSQGFGVGLEDPHEISDRMAREITRGFEKIGVLHFNNNRTPTRYVSIHDQLLADLVEVFKKVEQGKASLNSEKSPEQLPLTSFTRMVKEDFRILINPDDILEYLESCDFRSLGIDLRIAKGLVIADYYQFTERLEALGLATIRPDGEVMINLEH